MRRYKQNRGRAAKTGVATPSSCVGTTRSVCWGNPDARVGGGLPPLIPNRLMDPSSKSPRNSWKPS